MKDHQTLHRLEFAAFAVGIWWLAFYGFPSAYRAWREEKEAETEDGNRDLSD